MKIAFYLFFLSFVICGFLITGCALPPDARWDDSAKTSVSFFGSKKKSGPAPTRPLTEINREKLEHLRSALAEYNRDYGEFPKSLRDLSWTNGGEDYKDAWGHELGYSVNPEKIVRIWSLGADNQISGTGENADVFMTFSPLDITLSRAEKATAPAKKWF